MRRMMATVRFAGELVVEVITSIFLGTVAHEWCLTVEVLFVPVMFYVYTRDRKWHIPSFTLPSFSGSTMSGGSLGCIALIVVCVQITAALCALLMPKTIIRETRSGLES